MPVWKVGEGLDWLGRLQSLWDAIPETLQTWIKGGLWTVAISLGVVLVDTVKPLPAGQLYLYVVAAGAITAIAYVVVRTLRHETESPPTEGDEHVIPDVSRQDSPDRDPSVSQQARADSIKALVELTEYAVRRLLHDPQGGAGLPERVDAWEQQVLAALTAAGASESDKSFFRVLIFYKPRGLTARTPALTKIREEVGEKIERLRSITRKLEEASGKQTDAFAKEHQDADQPARSTELPESELTLGTKERDNSVFIVVRNPQREPKSGHSVWVEDLQKFSPEVGFHPVAEFDKASKPCQLALSAGETPLYHDKKNLYLLMAGSNQRTARVVYRPRKLQQEIIQVGAGTWRFKIRIEWEGRTRVHYVFIKWEGPRQAPIVTTDPTATPV